MLVLPKERIRCIFVAVYAFRCFCFEYYTYCFLFFRKKIYIYSHLLYAYLPSFFFKYFVVAHIIFVAVSMIPVFYFIFFLLVCLLFCAVRRADINY